jgi:DNA invertase Pin-like site-specific DNA recombinase
MAEHVGYARVSSTGQSLDVQLAELAKAGCAKVFSEKRSGRHVDRRPELAACLRYVREGDTLVISRLDRMARSLLDLANIAELLRGRKVNLKVLNQGIDTSTSEGKLMFGVLSSFAEFEADIRAERQKDGIEMAQRKGVKFGRKRRLTADQTMLVRRLRKEEAISVDQIAERLAVSRATIYRALSAEAS